MEEGMEVDMEESEATPNSKHSKRFGLKNTVQTNFGEDYVFQIVPKYVSLNFSSFPIKYLGLN